MKSQEMYPFAYQCETSPEHYTGTLYQMDNGSIWGNPVSYLFYFLYYYVFSFHHLYFDFFVTSVCVLLYY